MGGPALARRGQRAVPCLGHPFQVGASCDGGPGSFRPPLPWSLQLGIWPRVKLSSSRRRRASKTKNEPAASRNRLAWDALPAGPYPVSTRAHRESVLGGWGQSTATLPVGQPHFDPALSRQSPFLPRSLPPLTLRSRPPPPRCVHYSVVYSACTLCSRTKHPRG